MTLKVTCGVSTGTLGDANRAFGSERRNPTGDSNFYDAGMWGAGGEGPVPHREAGRQAGCEVAVDAIR